MADSGSLIFRGGPADGTPYEFQNLSPRAKWVEIPIVGQGKARYLIERMAGRPVALVYVGGGDKAA